MTSLPTSTVLLLCAGALGTGVLGAWACQQLWPASRGSATARAHREALAGLRRRSRRRLRRLREVLARHRSSAEELRCELAMARGQQDAQQRLLAGTRAEADRLRASVMRLEAVVERQVAALAATTAQAAVLRQQLEAAREQADGFEREHGLLRIEHDELIARSQRLRALAAGPGAEQAAAPRAGMPDSAPAAGALRTTLAERNERIHELECRLREREARMGELQTTLDTWKYRIAPLALHMKLKHERQQASAPARPAPVARPDDLQRIRGIGRGIERKLRDRGIERFQQLAGMAPAELANLATAIGVAASRPARDGWAEQARSLAGADPGAVSV